MLTLVLRATGLILGGSDLETGQRVEQQAGWALTNVLSFPSIGGDGTLETHTTLPSKWQHGGAPSLWPGQHLPEARALPPSAGREGYLQGGKSASPERPRTILPLSVP